MPKEQGVWQQEEMFPPYSQKKVVRKGLRVFRREEAPSWALVVDLKKIAVPDALTLLSLGGIDSYGSGLVDAVARLLQGEGLVTAAGIVSLKAQGGESQLKISTVGGERLKALNALIEKIKSYGVTVSEKSKHRKRLVLGSKAQDLFRAGQRKEAASFVAQILDLEASQASLLETSFAGQDRQTLIPIRLSRVSKEQVIGRLSRMLALVADSLGGSWRCRKSGVVPGPASAETCAEGFVNGSVALATLSVRRQSALELSAQHFKGGLVLSFTPGSDGSLYGDLLEVVKGNGASIAACGSSLIWTKKQRKPTREGEARGKAPGRADAPGIMAQLSLVPVEKFSLEQFTVYLQLKQNAGKHDDVQAYAAKKLLEEVQ